MTHFQRLFGLVAFGLLAQNALPAHSQAWQWAAGVSAAPGSTSNTYVLNRATAISPSGETYAALMHRGTVTIGGQPYTAPSGASLVVHYGTGGNVLDVALVGTNADVNQLKFDAAGNLYALGRFTNLGGSLQLANQQVTATSAATVFLIKWNAAGVPQWVQQGTVSLAGTGRFYLTVDGAGHATVAACYTGTAQFGTSSVSATPGESSTLLAQYDATGSVRWVRTSANETRGAYPQGVSAAPDGTLYLLGTCGYNPNGASSFWWGTSFVASRPIAQGAPRGFWLKLNSNGDLLAQQRYGPRSSATIEAFLATDNAGAAYVAAEMSYQTSAFYWGSDSVTVPHGRWGALTMRLDGSGTPQWMRWATTSDSSDVRLTSLCTSGDVFSEDAARVYLGGRFSNWRRGDNLECGSLAIHSPYLRDPDGYVLALDAAAGTPRWLVPVASTNAVDYLEHLSANSAGQLGIGLTSTGDTAYFGSIHLVNRTPQNDHMGYVAKLVQSYNQLRGTAFADTNGNNSQDVSEPGYPGVIVALATSPADPITYLTSAAAGQYSAVADLGSYSVSVPNPPLYHTVVPTSPAPVSFTSYGHVSAGHDFAIQPIPNQQDLTVTLTPVNRARPGFAVVYRIRCTNVGTEPSAFPNLHLTYDSRLTFVSSSHFVASTPGALVAALGLLEPGQTVDVDVLFQLAVTAQLGSSLSTTATLAPLNGDLTPTDNTETSTLTVTGSYDPNDIQVNYTTLPLSDVQAGARPLDYTVRFQNVGTDTAFTVTLRDTIPAALLNLGTLQLLAASHTCTWRLGAGGVLTVTFPNIHLPARSVNTLRSMGFVRFRVVPTTTLAAGDLIPNAARIHFDFNAPVVTNTALTTVLGASGLAPATGTLAGGVWPNPATTTLCVAVAAPTGAAVRFTLTDGLGREVRAAQESAGTGPTTEHRFDLTGLAPGLYSVRAQAGGRPFYQRVIIGR